MNDEGVCRTAPATPGLSTTQPAKGIDIVQEYTVDQGGFEEQKDKDEEEETEITTQNKKTRNTPGV